MEKNHEWKMKQHFLCSALFPLPLWAGANQQYFLKRVSSVGKIALISLNLGMSLMGPRVPNSILANDGEEFLVEGVFKIMAIIPRSQLHAVVILSVTE